MRYVVLLNGRSWPWFWRAGWRVVLTTDNYDLAVRTFRVLSNGFPRHVRMYEQLFVGTYSASQKE